MASENHAQPEQAWSLGPMIHYEFGGPSSGWTWGVEGSWWWVEHWWTDSGVYPAPVGLDLGFEITRTGTRLYTEAQTGIIGGASLGPFVEIPRRMTREEFRMNWGLQGSVWWFSFFAFDLRGRWSPEGAAVSPGSFMKIFGCAVDCSSINDLLEMISDLPLD